MRGKGLMLGIELVKDRATKEPAKAECAQVFETCRDMGLLFGKGGLTGKRSASRRRCASTKRTPISCSKSSTRRCAVCSNLSSPQPAKARETGNASVALMDSPYRQTASHEQNHATPLLHSFLSFSRSCDTATPENYFDRAVLNCNLMHGFAGSGLRRELESPSVKLSETGNGETIPMKRKEVIDNAITSLETNFEKVKKLKETDDTRDILRASVALYEFVLPVYKTEY